MAKTEHGLIVKIVAGSDTIKAYTDTSKAEEAFQLELMRPYFVICEDGDYYRVTNMQASSVKLAESGKTGYVLREQAYPRPTLEALGFQEISFIEDISEVLAWGEEQVLDDFMATGNTTLYPPVFHEDRETAYTREQFTRPYLVLGSDIRKFLKTSEKRVYRVLLPATFTSNARIEITKDDIGDAKKALSSTTILFVYDLTGSQGILALEVADVISDLIAVLPKDVVEGLSIGFLFFRDQSDDETLVEVAPLPLADAARVLERAEISASGGGDAAEPILDAMYYAANLYDWGQAGKKIVVAVLNDDAKPTTVGSIDPLGRVPVGLDALSVAQFFRDKSIPVITVQEGSFAGPNLIEVLSVLADANNGSFIQWDAGTRSGDMAKEVTQTMVNLAAEEIARGKDVLKQLKFDLNGIASIPLDVLDGEMLERLRAASVGFSIDPGNGGMLMREGFILETPDLLSPQILIDKETLLSLINLYSVLSVVGVDEEDVIYAVSMTVAAIAGEVFDPSEPIDRVVEKKLGIQFRTGLLNLDLANLAPMSPSERLAMNVYIANAATALNQYYHAHQNEFDYQHSVWMPLALLP